MINSESSELNSILKTLTLKWYLISFEIENVNVFCLISKCIIRLLQETHKKKKKKKKDADAE